MIFTLHWFNKVQVGARSLIVITQGHSLLLRHSNSTVCFLYCLPLLQMLKHGNGGTLCTRLFVIMSVSVHVSLKFSIKHF